MELVGLIGYGLATLAFLLFFLLLELVKQKTFISKVMLFLTLTIFISSIVSVLQLYHSFSLLVVFSFEILKLASISFFILILKHQPLNIHQVLAIKHIKQFLFCAVGSFVIAIVVLFQTHSVAVLFIVLLALNLYPLVLLEQVFRNANKKERWALWPIVSGFGALLVFDFALYAQASLVNTIDFDLWYVRGYIASIMMPFLLLGSKRLKNLSVDIFVSRDVVFYSSMLAITGGYLLILAFSGYVIRFIDGQWSNALSSIFLFLGGLLLVVLMITDSFKRKVKVFISKHFFANKYEYRDEWLKVTNAIEGLLDENFYDNSCKIMGESFQVEHCVFVQVSVFDQLKIKSSSDIVLGKDQLKQLQHIITFCRVNQWIIDLREYQNKPETYPDLKLDITALSLVNISTLVPIYKKKTLFGFFALSGVKEERVINWEDRDYLFAVSKQLANGLFLQQAQTELAESQQFSMFNRMSAFVLHDLKNIQAQLSLIIANSERHRDNQEFIDDVFITVGSANDRLKKVTSQLRNKSIKSKHSFEVVNINELLREIVNLRSQQQDPVVSLTCDEDIQLEVNKDHFYAVITHLIQNAQDATARDGNVSVSCEKSENKIILIVEDTGCGMSERFIQVDLFKPFITTKGNAGMGIGAYEVQQFVYENKGQLNVESKVGHGSRFEIILYRNI